MWWWWVYYFTGIYLQFFVEGFEAKLIPETLSGMKFTPP